MLDAVHAEREALLKDVERQRRETLADAARVVEGVVDRITLRLSLAAALAGAAVAGVAFALGRAARPS